MNSTEAWVLYASGDHPRPELAELRRERITIPDLTDHDVLAEPLYGCWEANMAHAVARSPVDICRERGEEKIVLGNSGVVRVLKTGAAVTGMREGDVCMVFGNAVADEFGYMKKALAYDAPNTMGVLAKRTRLSKNNLIPLPAGTRYSYKHWAAFSLRYVTAWTNWNVAYGCWRVQMSEQDLPAPFVWGWGGGTTLAELTLAQRQGCRVAMLASSDQRLDLIKRMGIHPLDRRAFGNLEFDEKRYGADPDYRRKYLEAEGAFLDTVRERTQGLGVSIFVDYIGAPVSRVTLRALGRQGVLATAGWKCGMVTSSVRALECINRHIHVHTHFARYAEARAAMYSAENTGWMPPLEDAERCYEWDDVPELVRDYASSRIDSYFPLFRVNPL